MPRGDFFYEQNVQTVFIFQRKYETLLILKSDFFCETWTEHVLNAPFLLQYSIRKKSPRDLFILLIARTSGTKKRHLL